ncbi:MAG: hypothetical protein PHN56_04315 [Candidatus Nanoarchaeia archaeon]|nr:hypothetical protein [Candidatus Nanoarchaeia archaeon]
MPSKFITSKIVININNQIFNYSDFYLFLKKILQERGYYIEEKGYTHNTLNNSESVDFYWQTVKRVDDFTKYIIELMVKLTLEDINIIKEKRKEMSNKGSGSIKIRSSLETDYAGKWEESNPVITFVKVLFENIFQKGSVNEYTKKLTDEAYDIENEVKSFFNLQKMM